MSLFSRRALAIVNLLIFVFIFTLLSAILLSSLSSYTRLLEHDIRRIKSFYVAEAGSVYVADYLRRTGSGPAVPTSVPWNYDMGGTVQISYSPSTTLVASVPLGLKSCYTINSTRDYTSTGW